MVCCGGRPVACASRRLGCGDNERIKDSGKGCLWAEQMINDCIRRHKKKHFDHIAPCPSSGDHCSVWSANSDQFKYRSECEAYRIELACLEEKVGICDRLLDPALGPKDPPLWGEPPQPDDAERLRREDQRKRWRKEAAERCRELLNDHIKNTRRNMEKYCAGPKP